MVVIRHVLISPNQAVISPLPVGERAFFERLQNCQMKLAYCKKYNALNKEKGVQIMTNAALKWAYKHLR